MEKPLNTKGQMCKKGCGIEVFFQKVQGRIICTEIETRREHRCKPWRSNRPRLSSQEFMEEQKQKNNYKAFPYSSNQSKPRKK